MQQYLTIVLTAVISISTIIYTIYSARLYKTTRQAAEISRQAALANLWSELNNYIEVCKRENLPEAAFFQKLSGIFAEYIIASLMNDTNANTDPNLKNFQQKISQMIASADFDTNKIGWLSSFTKAIK